MIELREVSKRFRLYRRPLDRVLSWSGMPSRHRDFWALRDITLSLPAGRTLGIVGPNGAGKSTLLKIVTGTLLPTSGSLRVDGRIAALLELGTGFHPEFTGRQNIWINGQLLGLSAGEIAAAEQDIIAFSELGAFIDQPLRTYSSGMIVRLGFSIAASVNPQVLIVDEALAVGDARFSQKCIRRIRRFRESGTTILFVSHDPSAVSTLCDEAVLLDQGTIVNRGTPAEVLEHYGALIASRGEGNAEMQVRWVRKNGDGEAATPSRFGTFQALVTRLDLCNEQGESSDIFLPDGKMLLRLSVLFLARIEHPTVGFMIRDRLGIDVFGTNTALQQLDLGTFEPGETLDLEISLPLQLGDGDYTLTAAVHRDETHLEECYDWSDRLAAFRVRLAGRRTFSGRVRLDPKWDTRRHAAAKGTVAGALESVFGHVGDALTPARGTPSPFLGGFFHPEHTAEGAWFRWMGARGIFVLRPSTTRLVLAVGLPPHAAASLPVELRLSSVEHGEAGRCTIDQSLAVAEFHLPAEAVGKLGLFELAVDRTWMESGENAVRPRELGAAIHAIGTISPGEAMPSWDDMMRSSLSATSSAS